MRQKRVSLFSSNLQVTGGISFYHKYSQPTGVPLTVPVTLLPIEIAVIFHLPEVVQLFQDIDEDYHYLEMTVVTSLPIDLMLFEEHSH